VKEKVSGPVSSKGTPLYGLMAEFETPKALVKALRQVRAQGYTKIDAYTPFPIEEVIDALDPPRSKVPAIVLGGGLVGGLAGYGLQWWVNLIDYPLNIGGRPLNSWVAFIPPTFETTVLFAGISALIGMLAVNGLPRPYHPVFNVPRFQLASRDRYFLVVEASDPKFDTVAVRDALAATGAADVHEVEE
jgi:hypothetical protein